MTAKGGRKVRALITGGEGQLGRDLAARFRPAGEVDAPGREGLDITLPGSVRARLARFRPDVVVHAAAWTDVDGCEGDEARAFFVNEEGTKNVAVEACRAGARLVAISTDFVFDGASERPYTEEDPPAPLSVYGRSKLAGERAAREAVPGAAIVRTAWLYGEGGKRNFVRSILRAAGRGKELRVVADQFGSPSFTDDVAAAIVALVAAGGEGLFHVVNGGEASRFDFARAILDLSDRKDAPVRPIATADLKLPAPRPARSTLGGTRLAGAGVRPLRPWREALADFLGRIGERSDSGV